MSKALRKTLKKVNAPGFISLTVSKQQMRSVCSESAMLIRTDCSLSCIVREGRWVGVAVAVIAVAAKSATLVYYSE